MATAQEINYSDLQGLFSKFYNTQCNLDAENVSVESPAEDGSVSSVNRAVDFMTCTTTDKDLSQFTVHIEQPGLKSQYASGGKLFNRFDLTCSLNEHGITCSSKDNSFNFLIQRGEQNEAKIVSGHQVTYGEQIADGVKKLLNFIYTGAQNVFWTPASW